MNTSRLALAHAIALAIGLSIPSPARAQTASPSPAAVSDARVKELLADARALSIPSSQTPNQATAGAPGAELLPLRLDEAVQFALERNLDIAVERLNPQTFALAVDAVRANFLPTVSSLVSQNNAVTLPSNQLAGGTRVENNTTAYNFGATEALPWGGGSLGLGWSNRRVDSTSDFNTYNPQYTSSLTFAFNQPLLRNLSTDTTRTQLRITRLNYDISEIQLRAVITNTLANVRNAYWDLVFAVESLEVARRSLALAEKLLEDNKVRVEVGTLAPLDVVQAEAEAATRRQALAQAEATARTTELALKRLIVSGTDDPRWKARLSPIDRPAFRPEHIDVETALRTALERRTDLQENRRNQQINAANLALLRNQTMPGLDLVTSYGLQGIGGTELLREGGLGSPVTGTVPGGFGDALRVLGRRDYPTWSVGLQVSYPIGTSVADANYARAKITVQQTEAQLKAMELQVATEVTNTALIVESTLQQVEAAGAARELAQRRLDAEQSKFEVGMSTNFFVVQAQRDLADAQNAELRAQLDYRKSLVDFERAQETSLATAGINLVSPSNTLNTPRASANVGFVPGGGQGQNQP